ncbi:MAG: hypothetical protein U9P12_08700 [Verrucomicrobiota bacterium]|nr:hypothetical protein [Verrucomicrobiota bacterium]
MNAALKSYIEQYTELEAGMQELIRRKGNLLCSQCSCICCDVVMCIEAIKSPFLKRVHQQADQFSEQHGFLSDTGCMLQQGRPPICYQYFCDDHFYHQPDELHAEVLKVLGALLNHATRNALGDIPLDDIMQEGELDRLDFQRLEKQMKESLQALETIRAFYRDGTLPAASHQALKKIRLDE